MRTRDSGPVPNPLRRHDAWFPGHGLDVASLHQVAFEIVGEHDFSSFCKRPKVAPGEEPVSLVRRVTEASWVDVGNGELVFHIAGSAFCHQMVRSIVGFHVAIGRGKRSAGEMRAVLAAKDRRVAEQPAPPHGLTLMAVHYD